MLLLLTYLGFLKVFQLLVAFFMLHPEESKAAALRVCLNAEGNYTWVTARKVQQQSRQLCSHLSVSYVLW